MQRAETDACRLDMGVVREGKRGSEGGVGWQCVHTQLCRSTSVHSECVSVCNGMCGMQSRSCHCCLSLPQLPSPLLPATPTRSALSGQQLLFSNGRQGNKSFAHSPHFQSPPSFRSPPSTPHSQQINGHKAFLPARRWVGAKFTSRRRRGRGTLLELSASPRKL